MKLKPAFARDFPNDEALDALVAAFVRGDYAHVRSEAPKLAACTEDEEVRRAAKVLRQRVDADPLAKILLGMTLLILLFLTGWWIAHDQPPPFVTIPSAPLIERIKSP